MPNTPTRTNTTRKPERDWIAITAEYVEGVEIDGTIRWLTMTELAARHGIPEPTVRNQADRRNWTEARSAFQRRMEFERQNARAVEVARLGTDLDVSALRIARNGLSITGARLAELAAQAGARSRELQEHPDERPKSPAVNAQEMDRLSRAANEWYALGAKAIGDVQRVRVDVDVDVQVTEAERDLRSMGLVAILSDIGKIEEEITDVIDVGPGRLRLAPLGDPAADRGPADAEGQRVHPEDADDAEPQPAPDSIPSAG